MSNSEFNRVAQLLPIGPSIRFGLQVNGGRTKVMGTKSASFNVVFYVERQLFVVLWDTEVAMGWVILGEEDN